MPAPRRSLLPLGLAAALAGCGDYPRDPERSLQRIEGGVLYVGVSQDPPFVHGDGTAVRGREAALARALARAHDARVVWIHGGHDDLMRRLETFQLDLVVGGHDRDSPWRRRVASSRPYRIADGRGRVVERVAALPPGENAWLLAFDRHARSDDARRILEDDARRRGTRR